MVPLTLDVSQLANFERCALQLCLEFPVLGKSGASKYGHGCGLIQPPEPGSCPVEAKARAPGITSSLHFGSGMVQSQPMLIGPLLNVTGILIGGTVGLLRRKP